MESENDIILETGLLSPDVCKIIISSISENTKKAMLSDLRTYCLWCESKDLVTLPCQPEQIAEYAVYMMNCGKKTSTIVRAISSISRVHQMKGHESPAKTELVRRVMKGIKRNNVADKKQARPLSPEDLITCIKNQSATSWPGIRNRAMLVIGWLGALRVSEISALNTDDIEREEEGFVLRIKKSKTDQEAEGFRIALPHSKLSDIIDTWINRLGTVYDGATGPLFPSFRRSEIWFPLKGMRKAMSVRALSTTLKKIFVGAGLSEGYSCHSLRSGMITWAARVGVPERHIQNHSRHRSVTILRDYIRDGSLFLDHPLSPIFDRFAGSFEQIDFSSVQ